MSNNVNPSPDRRVNQQIIRASLNEMKIVHYINLEGTVDMGNARLKLFQTYSIGMDEYDDIVTEFELSPPDNCKISFFRYDTFGDVTPNDKTLIFPEKMDYKVAGVPHIIVTVLSPANNLTSTAKGEAL